MNILKKIIERLFRAFASPHYYAHYLGVKIGDNCMIATRNWSTEPYLITIRNNVQVTQDVHFHTHGGAHVARKKYPNFDVFGKIEIKDNAYIGSASHIMPGVTIGNNSMIAAGSVVCKSVPDNELWGGVPAKRICSIEDYIARNIAYNTDSKKMSPEEKRKLLLSLPDSKFIKK